MAVSEIQGDCSPDFKKLQQVFETNFHMRGEVGASVCLYHHGVKQVDLWGGVADPATGRPWDKDTIVCMMSVGKAMVALCLLRLIDRGLVNLDHPVAQYWPAFSQANKSEITVRVLLGGLAGLIYADHAPVGSAFDWDVMVKALAKQAPIWAPGTVGAYHSMTAGHLLGELVRQVDGRDINVFFAEEIAIPLNIDYKFGLNDSDIARTAPIIPNPDSDTLAQISDPQSKLGRAWRIIPKAQDIFNSEPFRKAVFPSANGHGNARAIAHIYAALSQGGEIDGYRLLSPELIEEIRTISWAGQCGLTDRNWSYGLGFFICSPPLIPFGPNKRAFGHPGAGGAIGFCDPEAGISFSYSPNYMCSGDGVGDRCELLVKTVFECLE